MTGNGSVKGPASYFTAIEKKYGRPIAEWQAIVHAHLPAKHMALVAMLKDEHQMGYGHANASLRMYWGNRRRRPISEITHLEHLS